MLFMGGNQQIITGFQVETFILKVKHSLAAYQQYSFITILIIPKVRITALSA